VVAQYVHLIKVAIDGKLIDKELGRNLEKQNGNNTHTSLAYR